MKFEVDNGTDVYRIRMFHAAGDSMIFAEEALSYHQTGYITPKTVSLGAGHQEACVRDFSESEPLQNTLRNFLNHCRVYHFHDTSQTARIRQFCYAGDNRWLMPDAANLAAVLYRLVPVREYPIWTDVGSSGSWSARTEPVTDRESVADSLEMTTTETLLVVGVTLYVGSIGR